MDRESKVLAEIDRGMRVLELGPSYAPLAPKAAGWNVFTVDHASREQLAEKYREHPHVDASQIEEVDVIWTAGPLHEAVPADLHGEFDACIASHVVEHVPDLLGLLDSLEIILAPSGVLSLVIPDRRFCFDYFRPLSTTGEILEAHRRPPLHHRPKSVFDHVAYAVAHDGKICWDRSRVERLAFVHTLGLAYGFFEHAAEGDGQAEYFDCHAWQFTPASFELALLELNALRTTSFGLVRSFPTSDCEFYATLRQGRPAELDEVELQARRLELLGRGFAEAAEQFRLFEPPGGEPAAPHEARVAGLEAELSKVLDSKSWRATAPLRGLARALRQWRPSGRR